SVIFMLPIICVPSIMWTSFNLKKICHSTLGWVISALNNVQYEDGDLKFSLESVKKLKDLMDENRHINPRFVLSMASYSPCDEKDLPEEFQSVCKREDASVIFERLSTFAKVSTPATCQQCLCI
uniref:Guanylate cyclase activator 2B n=1 Tax=Melopsittacus undulatus TaxID=13146 RepID=A0A8C6JWA4_MELUD